MMPEIVNGVKLKVFDPFDKTTIFSQLSTVWNPKITYSIVFLISQLFLYKGLSSVCVRLFCCLTTSKHAFLQGNLVVVQ